MLLRIEGLWSVEFFAANGESGAGVIAFRDYQCFGGDSRYYYRGNYTLTGDTLAVNMRVRHHAGDPANIFGLSKEFHLGITARVSEPWIMGQGVVVENPALRMSCRLKRLEFF